GSITINGLTQAANTNIDVPSFNLSTVNYVGGANGASELEWIQVYDGKDWGSWVSWTMTALNHAPVAAAPNGSVVVNASVLASSLFSVRYADGDAIRQYRFWDGGVAGASVTVSGVPRAAQRNMVVDAGALAMVNDAG